MVLLRDLIAHERGIRFSWFSRRFTAMADGNAELAEARPNLLRHSAIITSAKYSGKSDGGSSAQAKRNRSTVHSSPLGAFAKKSRRRSYLGTASLQRAVSRARTREPRNSRFG